jgi:hypothetical protein
MRTCPMAVSGRFGRVLGPGEEIGGCGVNNRSSRACIVDPSEVRMSSALLSGVSWYRTDSGSSRTSIAFEQSDRISRKSAVPSRTHDQLPQFTIEITHSLKIQVYLDMILANTPFLAIFASPPVGRGISVQLIAAIRVSSDSTMCRGLAVYRARLHRLGVDSEAVIMHCLLSSSA